MRRRLPALLAADIAVEYDFYAVRLFQLRAAEPQSCEKCETGLLPAGMLSQRERAEIVFGIKGRPSPADSRELSERPGPCGMASVF